MRARVKLPAGVLTTRHPSKQYEAVLNASGSRCESVLFDFAHDGGAVGTIDFHRLIPKNAIVIGVVADEMTALTSGGSATLKLKAGATDLTAALAFDTGFAGATTLALASSATAIKLSVDSDLSLVIAGAALTAGKVRFYVRYVLIND